MSDLGNVNIVATTAKDGYIVEVEIEKMTVKFKPSDYLPTFPSACNKLCPQGWAWLIGGCDFGQNCGACEEPEAPIYADRRILGCGEQRK